MLTHKGTSYNLKSYKLLISLVALVKFFYRNNKEKKSEKGKTKYQISLGAAYINTLNILILT